MVKTKSVYDPVEELDGDRILVTRYWPRGISRDSLAITGRLQNLAPSKELLGDWKQQSLSWQEYTLWQAGRNIGKAKTIESKKNS